MTLVQFRIFAAIVDTGGFTTAGETLGLTQSAVSHAMAGLEDELGARLLERKRDGVHLTELGELVLSHIRAILTRTERLRQDADAMVGLHVDKLRIGSVHSAASRLLPGMIGSFRRECPGIEVVVMEGRDQDVQEWLSVKAIDLGIGESTLQEMDFIPVAQDPLLAVVPHTHQVRSQSSIRVEQIAQDPFIMCKSGTESLIKSAFYQAGVMPRTQFEVLDAKTLLTMVHEGLGMAMIPELALPDQLPDVHLLQLDPPVHRQLGLMAPSLEHANDAVRTFVRHAQNLTHVDLQT